MYIFVLKKTTNTFEGLKLAWCGGNLWPLNTYLYLFLQNESDDYLHIFLHQKSFEKKTFKTGFSEHNSLLSLRIQNSQRLLYSRKTGIKTVFEHCVHNKI